MKLTDEVVPQAYLIGQFVNCPYSFCRGAACCSRYCEMRRIHLNAVRQFISKGGIFMDKAWKKFQKSGRIADYLEYCRRRDGERHESGS